MLYQPSRIHIQTVREIIITSLVNLGYKHEAMEVLRHDDEYVQERLQIYIDLFTFVDPPMSRWLESVKGSVDGGQERPSV